MAGKPVGRVGITDYDRIPDDIAGDGNAFDLASKRTTTFGSFAMTLAESSPSREITDYKKVVRGHAAPPPTGILALYNRGERRNRKRVVAGNRGARSVDLGGVRHHQTTP